MQYNQKLDAGQSTVVDTLENSTEVVDSLKKLGIKCISYEENTYNEDGTVKVGETHKDEDYIDTMDKFLTETPYYLLTRENMPLTVAIKNGDKDALAFRDLWVEEHMKHGGFVDGISGYSSRYGRWIGVHDSQLVKYQQKLDLIKIVEEGGKVGGNQYVGATNCYNTDSKESLEYNKVQLEKSLSMVKKVLEKRTEIFSRFGLKFDVESHSMKITFEDFKRIKDQLFSTPVSDLDMAYIEKFTENGNKIEISANVDGLYAYNQEDYTKTRWHVTVKSGGDITSPEGDWGNGPELYVTFNFYGRENILEDSDKYLV